MLDLLGDAVAQDLGHAQVPLLAGLAGAAGPDLVHAQQVLDGRQVLLHQLGLLLPDLVDLRLGHADGDLAVVDAMP